MRRLRRTETIRRMVRETSLSPSNLIYPIFVVSGKGIREEIKSLPGNYHVSPDMIVREILEIKKLGISAVLLFGVPETKDSLASQAYSDEGVVQQAVREIKDADTGVAVITDVCLCEYTDHGHCGIMKNGQLLNDESLELISRVALSHARAGADMVAPAAMLDGQIKAIRTILDQNNFPDTAIMAYSVKYASILYEMFFKEGVKTVLKFGDKSTHQMDFSNSDEAMREIMLDIEEGADIIMVKPALFYLDIVYRAKNEFKMPLAVYNVSGEFAMVKSMAKMGYVDETRLCREIFVSLRRAGADLIITYHAKEMARELLKFQQG
jgi:porphobilinogen synthase